MLGIAAHRDSWLAKYAVEHILGTIAAKRNGHSIIMHNADYETESILSLNLAILGKLALENSDSLRLAPRASTLASRTIWTLTVFEWHIIL